MNRAPSRIVLTGDMLRSYSGERAQFGNVEWVQRRFGPVLSAVTGLVPEIRLAGSPPFAEAAGLGRLFQTFDLEPNVQNWARIFWKEPPAELIEFLAPDYADAVAVSIEMPPVIEKALNILQVPWIDVGISPIRFLPDLCISFRTSCHFRNHFPPEFHLQEETINLSMNLLRKNYASVDKFLLNDAIVFFAQTEDDRTLIKGGQFAGADEAVAALQPLCAGRKLLIKPHPWHPNNPVVSACAEAFRGEITALNTYEILAADANLDIVTLSSSVGPEARLFGRRTHVAYDAVQRLAFSGPTTMIHGRSTELWRVLLSAIMPVRSAVGESWRPNELRRELGSFGLAPAIYEQYDEDV